MNIDNINSFKEAKIFWVDEFGDPDYYTRPGDLDDIVEILNMFKAEKEKLEREIKNYNVNNYKLNRCITLHFVVDAGNQYLDEAHTIAYENYLEEEFDKIDNYSNENAYWED